MVQFGGTTSITHRLVHGGGPMAEEHTPTTLTKRLHEKLARESAAARQVSADATTNSPMKTKHLPDDEKMKTGF